MTVERFEGVLGCSVGGDNFRLIDYGKSADAAIGTGGLRTGTNYTITLTGEILVDAQADMPAALAAFETAVLDADGDTLVITAHGDPLETIDAEGCTSGPILKYAYGSGRGATWQPVTITATCTSSGDGEGEGVASSETTVRTSWNVEELRTVRTSGRIVTTTVSATGAALAAMPALADGWQDTTYSTSANDADTLCTWESTQTELVAAYPLPTGGAAIVDGERTITTTRDGHNRETTVESCRYVGPGAEDYVHERLALRMAGGGLVRSSIAITRHKTETATATFEVLGAANGDLLELTETVGRTRSGPLLREQSYAGTTPLIFQEADRAYVYTQSGRAVGLMRYPRPPAFLFPGSQVVADPIRHERPSDREFITTWDFRFLTTELLHKFPNDREGSPGFYAG